VMHDLQVAENLVSFSKQFSMQVTGVELKAQSNPHPAASEVRRGWSAVSWQAPTEVAVAGIKSIHSADGSEDVEVEVPFLKQD
jgi:hypothetical protein